jgi:hypothetical protein
MSLEKESSGCRADVQLRVTLWGRSERHFSIILSSRSNELAREQNILTMLSDSSR